MELRRAGRAKLMLTRSVLATVFACAVTTGCASMTGKIHESSRGSVYLEEVPDWSFEAAHPLSIDPTTMAHVMRGVQIEERKSMSYTTSGMEPKAAKAFSDDEVEFLAPLLATALSKADPEELVGFRLVQPASTGTVSTAGTLYAHGSYLYLNLTHYRSNSNGKSGRQLPGSGGLTRRVVSFVPETAQRPDSHRPPGAPVRSNLTTLVIDYAMLAQQPSSKPEPVKTPSTTQEVAPIAVSQASPQNDSTMPTPAAKDVHDADFLGQKLEELRVTKELVSKKDVEIKALKRDVQSLHRQLEKREAQDSIPTYHQVKPGETVFRLARKYGIRLEQVRKWNNLQNDSVEVGQKLIVGYKAEIQKLKDKKKPVQPAKKTPSADHQPS